MKSLNIVRLVVACGALTGLAAFGQVVASAPYTVSVFATSVPNVDYDPDSIAIANGDVFVGYGDGAAPDGSDGKSSTIVEYRPNGDYVRTYTVPGHNDGLRLNPKTKELWAMQNEDASPNLVIIDPVKQTMKRYTFGPTPHGGGYDDIAFRGDDVFLSCSNPANNPNTAPAIVKAQISGNKVLVTPVLSAAATAIDIPTDTPVALNLQDPDSMAFNRFGDLVLDSQADAEQIIVHHPGYENQSVYRLALIENESSSQIDDTVYASASHGVILVSDRDGETVYAISRDLFSPGSAYSATPAAVAALDQDTGILTDVVTGLVSPHGMAFIPQKY